MTGRRGQSLRRWPVLAVAATLLTGPAGAACGSDDEAAGQITVLAAASLTEAFRDLGEAFSAEHPEARVAFSFGASSALATQVNEGAPADVFASADEASMHRVVAAGNAAAPVVFGRNRLAILVRRGNPLAIAALADLARPDVTFVACAVEVPCGRFAGQALGEAGVTAKPRSYEENVKAVVTKVILGEADAGIVYATDVRAAGRGAQGVEIPEDENVVAVYPLAVLKQARHGEVAAAFTQFVVSAAGQAILAQYGFLAP